MGLLNIGTMPLCKKISIVFISFSQVCALPIQYTKRSASRYHCLIHFRKNTLVFFTLNEMLAMGLPYVVYFVPCIIFV